MFLTAPWPGLLLLEPPTIINCPQHFSKTSIRCSLAANQPKKRWPRWERSQNEFCGKILSAAILKDFAGGALTKGRALQEITGEGVGLRLTRSLFGGGIPRRLLRRVSLVKPISAPLRC